MPTTTKEPETKPVAKPETEESGEEIFQRSSKPPKEGPCKRCGHDRPLNRLMLCYPCWVKTKLEEKGWREGMPHPDDCRCAGECAVESKDAQN